MSYLRTTSLTIALLFHAGTSFASTTDADFQRCASEALEQRGQTVNTISINNGKLKKQDLNHSFSKKVSEYRMAIVDKSNGSELGTVTCTLDNNGDLIAATFN